MKIGLGAEGRNVDITLNVAPINLEPDMAIPVALFIVEGLTNSMKHGVAEGGLINISLSQQQDGEMTVSVDDNGRGASKTSTAGTGTKLMKGFARQLSGQWIDNDVPTGHKVSLVFKTENQI